MPFLLPVLFWMFSIRFGLLVFFFLTRRVGGRALMNRSRLFAGVYRDFACKWGGCREDGQGPGRSVPGQNTAGRQPQQVRTSVSWLHASFAASYWLLSSQVKGSHVLTNRWSLDGSSIQENEATVSIVSSSCHKVPRCIDSACGTSMKRQMLSLP